jgi:hypothetical protein
MKDTSPAGTLNSRDWKKWGEDSLYFFLSVLVIYLTSFAATLSLPNHIFDLMDLVPNLLTWGAILNYVINTIQNLIRKRNNGKEI